MSTLNEKLSMVLNDPAGIVRVAMEALESSTQGSIDIPDPTSPFSHNLEFAAVLAGTLTEHSESLYRKMYRVLATDYSELYHHLSDIDYLGVFSTPSECDFTFYFKKASLINAAVKVGDTETRKLVIPRNTVITINDTEFVLLYPIEIRIMAHGGIRVVYDNSVPSPLKTLTGNTIPWVSGFTQNTEVLKFDVPLTQLKRRVLTDNVNTSTGFKTEYEIVDDFYFARIWAKDSVGNKFELKTTFSEENYDPKVPTALLRQSMTGIVVEIPLLYITNRRVTDQVEIEIYTTKGPIKMDMLNYVPNSFGLRYGDTFDTPEDSRYSSPLLTLDTMGVMSIDVTRGGSRGLTFDQLRERSIQNGTIGEIPITDAQLENVLKVKGFDIVKSVDNLEDRIFLATRHLPTDAQGRFGSGMAVAIQPVEVSMEDIVQSEHCADNGNRVTILPSMLYEIKAGVTRIVPDANRPENRAQSDANLATLVNGSRYAYSPFHYVLDAAEKDFTLRPYYLDQPKIVSRSFIAENDTTQLSVSTVAHTIEKVANGYKLTIASRVGETYAGIDTDLMFAQLSFQPYREVDEAFINGEFKGVANGEYIWEFMIGTNHDVDSGHHLVLNNFSMYSDVPRLYPTDLLASFKLIYSVANYNVYGLQSSDLDNQLGLHLLPENITAISGETMSIKLGDNLSAMWSNSRTVPGALKYLRYETDVPKLHMEDKFLEDVNGHLVLEDTGTVLNYTVIHRKGDPVIIDGEAQYLHRKGDVVFNEITKQPEYESDVRSLKRHLDILLLDGAYLYVSDATDLQYRNEVPSTIVNYVVNELTPVTGKLLGNTRLHFYPKSTLSDTQVTIGEDTIYNLPSATGFKVTYALSGNNYRNAKLRESIETITGEAVNELIQLPTVSTDRLVEILKQRIGNDVISIDVGKFGPKKDIAVFSYLDQSSRASIKRVLRVLPSGKLTVEEDIDVQFVKFGA